MTTPIQDNQIQNTQQASNKELNFRAIEAKLANERAARIQAEQKVQELESRKLAPIEDEDDDSEPYVDKRKLNKVLNKFGEQNKQQTQSDIQKAVQQAIYEERKQNWVKQNPDFYNVLQHAEKIAQKDPELADALLDMPEGFERQRLVYKNIKALGLHEDAPKQPSIQDKVDANRKGPYYQPSGVGTAPYASSGDFSQAGQKNAYDKMQELKNRLRLG